MVTNMAVTVIRAKINCYRKKKKLGFGWFLKNGKILDTLYGLVRNGRKIGGIVILVKRVEVLGRDTD